MVTDHTGLCVAGHCRFCGSDLRGPEIPEDDRKHYGGKTHFSRVIGVEYGYGSPFRYDGVSEWRCPDCSVRINRWTHEVLGPLDAATPDGNRRLVDEVP
jgi:hypothetical protein